MDCKDADSKRHACAGIYIDEQVAADRRGTNSADAIV